MSKLILALIVGVFLGAFSVEMFGRSRLKQLARRFSLAWQRTKATANELRREFDDAYSAGAQE